MLEGWIVQLESTKFEDKKEEQRKIYILSELRAKLTEERTDLHNKKVEKSYGITKEEGVEIGDIIDELLCGYGKVESLPDESGLFKVFNFPKNEVIKVFLRNCRLARKFHNQ